MFALWTTLLPHACSRTKVVELLPGQSLAAQLQQLPDPMCPASCKCNPGNPRNGGKPLNSDGRCEAICSREMSGLRYCGDGPGFVLGNFIDCRGCMQSDMSVAIRLPAGTVSLDQDIILAGKNVILLGSDQHNTPASTAMPLTTTRSPVPESCTEECLDNSTHVC